MFNSVRPTNFEGYTLSIISSMGNALAALVQNHLHLKGVVPPKKNVFFNFIFNTV